MDLYRPLYVLLDAVEFEAKRLLNQPPPPIQPVTLGCLETQLSIMKAEITLKAAIKLRYHDDSFFHYREETTNTTIIGRKCLIPSCRHSVVTAIYDHDLDREDAARYLWLRVQLLYEAPCPRTHLAATEPR